MSAELPDSTPLRSVEPAPKVPPTLEEDPGPKIYLLPNLMTAGNLFCGFAASLEVVKGQLVKEAAKGETLEIMAKAADDAAHNIHNAIWLILASCVFDMLDGRLARLGGTDSDFGREFDSLADIVSFGVAPALMVYSVVLHQFTNVGWIIACLYLICGALRLARFNCLAAKNSKAANREFTGFPIPAAAGLIASLTLFLLWWDERLGNGKFLLPPLMIFLAWMMFSKFRYPSFKGIGWRTTRSLPRFMAIVLAVVITVRFYQWMPFAIFLTYLLYGFTRPFLSRKMKREIEEEDDDGDEHPETEEA